MKKRPDTIEDLLCGLESARDSLVLIHSAMENENASNELLMNAVFATYSHLSFIVKKMAEHIDHIPCDVLEKAGEEVA